MTENKNVDMENRIQELFNEVELYRQAMQDARDALASAEAELDATLDAAYGKYLD